MTLMVIKTTGLVYDDRLRKESESLRDAGYSVHIVALEAENTSSRGVTKYGIPYTTITLSTRDHIRQAHGLALKTSEMYGRMLWHIILRRPACVWIHNVEMMGLLPFLSALRFLGVIKRVVWDQHELPSSGTMSNRIFRRSFMLGCKVPDAIIVANRLRYDHLEELGVVQDSVIWRVVDNYSDDRFETLPRQSLPENISSWLRGRQYFLAQGGANPDRNFSSLVRGVVAQSRHPLIIVGPYKEAEVHDFRNRWPDLDDMLLFTGMVPQDDLSIYIDNALASIILYTKDDINSWLCSPNRLYQAISRGCPVIVGNNPPMRAVVEQTKAGVVLSDDGSDPASICQGVDRFLDQPEVFARNASSSSQLYNWCTQTDQLLEVVKL